MEAWIDTYHAVEGLARLGTYSFLTDGAVGAQKEDNLRHLIANLGKDVSREHIVPFLTTKHTLSYCLSMQTVHGRPVSGRSSCLVATRLSDCLESFRMAPTFGS